MNHEPFESAAALLPNLPIFVEIRMPTTQKKPLDLGILADSTGFYLRLAQIKVFKIFGSMLGELKVSPAIFSTMEILHLNPGITQARLAKAIHLDHSSMVPLLDKLESRGLIKRQVSLTDRRNKMVTLTEAGSELHCQASARVRQQEALVSECLTAAERRELFRLLIKFHKSLP